MRHPVVAPEEATFDPRLAGAWVGLDEEGNPVDATQAIEMPAVLHFGRADETAPENFIAIQGTMHDDDGRLHTRGMLAYSAQLGDDRYLVCAYGNTGLFQSLPATWEENSPYYCCARYEIRDGELLLYGVSGEAVDAIKNGQLAGSDYEPGSPFAELAATTEALQAYLAAGNELFGEEPVIRLRRIE